MTNARRLAGRFEASHSTLFDHGDDPPDFDAWLASFWRTNCPPEPDTCADAVSAFAGDGGGAVRWYDLDGAVLGYVPGQPRRCLWVPPSTVEPSLDEAIEEDGPPCDGDEHDLPRGALPPWLPAEH